MNQSRKLTVQRGVSAVVVAAAGGAAEASRVPPRVRGVGSSPRGIGKSSLGGSAGGRPWASHSSLDKDVAAADRELVVLFEVLKTSHEGGASLEKSEPPLLLRGAATGLLGAAVAFYVGEA